MSESDGRLAVLNPQLHDGIPLAEAARRAGCRAGPRPGGWRHIERTALTVCAGWIGPTGVVVFHSNWRLYTLNGTPPQVDQRPTYNDWR